MQSRIRATPLVLAALALAASPLPAAAQNSTATVALTAVESTTTAAGRAPAVLRSLDTKRYVIAAPDDAALKAVRVALDQAGAQFKRNFGTDAPRVRVLLADDPAAPVADAARDAAATARGTAPNDAALRAHSFVWPASVTEPAALAHEACHALVIAWADEKLARARTQPVRGAHAMHEQLPAWFSEAAATACEPEAARARRWATAGDALAHPMPLAELFGAAFPSDEKASSAFSWQSLSVIEYLADSQGDRALAKLADGLLAGRPAAEVLATLGVPTATLDNDWLQWSAAHAARGGGE